MRPFLFILLNFMVLNLLFVTHKNVRASELLDTQKIALFETMRNLSAGDLSGITIQISKPEYQQVTVKGSANELFFSKLVELGMADKIPPARELSPELTKKLLIYQIKEEKKPELLELLKEGRPEYKGAIDATINSTKEKK